MEARDLDDKIKMDNANNAINKKVVNIAYKYLYIPIWYIKSE